MTDPTRHAELQAILAAWNLGPTACRPVSAGHINRTFEVDAHGAGFMLQRLSPIFGPEVNLDIEAITAELERQGLLTPRLVRTRADALWHTDPDGGVWRLMTRIAGQTILAASAPADCAAAGRLLGRFHRALWRCDHTFVHRRPGVHDTPQHLEQLRRALRQHTAHALYDAIEPLGREILLAAGDLYLPADLPSRVVHGDPKISNVIFDPQGAALALVDLDTLARMPLPLELGDALRSWCAPLGEEVNQELDLCHFEATMQGYGDPGLLPAERNAIVLATELIAVELAARFCADALQETYFGWDRTRFGRAAEHNLVRARAQLHLARSIRGQREALMDVLRT